MFGGNGHDGIKWSRVIQAQESGEKGGEPSGHGSIAQESGGDAEVCVQEGGQVVVHEGVLCDAEGDDSGGVCGRVECVSQGSGEGVVERGGLKRWLNSS